MGLETPRLDDRTFNDLVAEARQRISVYLPEWTDHNLSDPGITLVELFAWLTDVVLYRLNRVPDKHFVKFMELIGMRLQEAEPARAPLTFWLSAPQETTVAIPSGTEVATVRVEDAPSIVFSTDAPFDILVPRLAHVLTSSQQAGGRAFQSHPIKRVQAGFEGFDVFASRPPQAGDAMYVGFEEDLSNHILGVELEVDTAEGAGIDPTDPPYFFEVLSTDQQWLRAEVDYDGTLGLNISGLIRIFLPAMERGSRNNQTAYWIRLRLEPGSRRSYGVSPTIRRLVTSSWGGTTDGTNVQRVRNEMLGRSDGTPGQRFYLTHTPVVPREGGEYLVVRIDNDREERWQEVADFSTSEPEDRHYTLDSSTGEIRMGPALPQRDGSIHSYGAVPPKEAFVVMRGYRYGGGQIGNVAAGTLNQLRSSIPYVARTSNRRPAAGGKDGESLENSKTRVPGYLRSINRAVTAADYEYLAQEAAPGMLSRVHCMQPPQTNKGEIKVLVIPHIPNLLGFIAPESLNVSSDLRNRVFAYLDERRLLATQLDVIPPVYLWVETEIRFRASPYYSTEDVRKAIEDRLFAFLNPITGGQDGKGWPFGRDLFIADIMAVLLTVPGVDFVRIVKLFPVSYDKGQFARGDEMQQITVPPNGMIVSYRHEVRAE
jgi:predicted phage baseplate assembly protein